MSRYSMMQVEFLDDVGSFSEEWLTSKYVKQSYDNSLRSTGPRGPENFITNYLSQGKFFAKDLYWHIELLTSNHKTEIRRSYFNMMQVFSSVGGLLQFITIGISTCYYFYNYYQLMRHAVLNSILGKPSLYPIEYQIKRSYSRLFFCGFVCPCCKC